MGDTALVLEHWSIDDVMMNEAAPCSAGLSPASLRPSHSQRLHVAIPSPCNINIMNMINMINIINALTRPRNQTQPRFGLVASEHPGPSPHGARHPWHLLLLRSMYLKYHRGKCRLE